MIEKYNYSPGPTNIRENVRIARSLNITNPDIDTDFVDYYKETCDIFNKIVNSNNDTYILTGEAILGLEAACASLTEENDKVLVIDNGLYGNGFKDFVTMYGGIPTLYSSDYKSGIDESKLEEFLKENSDFKYATIVHCDTPTGVINDLSKICPLLKKYGILTVVDSVSGMVGEPVSVINSDIDIIIGGSQKAFSGQPGITVISISEDAKFALKNRKSSIRSFYANLRIWENYLEERYFPYTISASDIISFRVAMENILEEGVENVLSRHSKIADSVRYALEKCGLKLFLNNSFSNTVTAIEFSSNIKATDISNYLKEKYNILIATSLGQYKDTILRIGHMGENAQLDKILLVLSALDDAFKYFKLYENENLVNEFLNNYNK